jgi:hypothetical protein
MKRVFNFIKHFGTFLFLTITTQVGGLIYLLSVLINKKWNQPFKCKLPVIFCSLYFVFTFLIIPFVAPIFGREKVHHNHNMSPTNYLTVILNRNYVRPEMNTLLKSVSYGLTKIESDIEIRYLDANFPFINKFPLLPHLSHNDGKKIDISLVYQTSEGEITNKKKSISGYGAFSEPKNGEYDQVNECKSNGYFQYDYPKYLTFGSINSELVLSEKGTKTLVNQLLKQKNLGKLFIEPHLKNRMKLTDSRVRYQGCRAVRHDDHIHIQLK